MPIITDVMRKTNFIVLLVMLVLLFVGCAAPNIHFEKNNVQKIKKIAVTTYDRKDGVTIFLPGMITGFGSMGAMVSEVLNEKKEKEMMTILGNWIFTEKFQNEFIEKLKNSQNYFEVYSGENFSISRYLIESIAERPWEMKGYPKEINKLKEKDKIDAILNLNIQYYGLYRKNAFSSTKLKLVVESKIVLIPNNKVVWRKTLDYSKLKTGTEFNFTYDEYKENNAKLFKDQLGKASSIVINELLTDLGISSIQ